MPKGASMTSPRKLSLLALLFVALTAALWYHDFLPIDEERVANATPGSASQRSRVINTKPGTVLITGSNRGIGLEFAKQYAEHGWTVIATHRRDETPESLQALIDTYDTVTAERMDVTHMEEIAALAAKLADTPIDVLVNNAAIKSAVGGYEQHKFGTLNPEHFDLYMNVNARGPIMVAQAFFDNVAASDRKQIVNISSSSGMVSHPPVKAEYMWYRASKAALNSLMVTMVPSAREAGVTVTMFEPGWTWTGPRDEKPDPRMLHPGEVVEEMITTINGFALRDTGKFFKRDGSHQAW